jgi:hypothetical protein
MHISVRTGGYGRDPADASASTQHGHFNQEELRKAVETISGRKSEAQQKSSTFLLGPTYIA